jgi:cytosine/adenosine deaminase-related metal-dependent hydrolase
MTTTTASGGATTLGRSERIVIRGARHPGDIAIRDGVIEAVGLIPEQPGDQVIRADGDIVTAGLINTHHHLYQWATRGRAVDSDLFGWLTALYPVWARLDPDDTYAAAVVGISELALSGCTTAADHHYLVPHGDDSVFDRLADAARAVGTRLHLARGSMDLGESDGGLPPDSVVEDTDKILASTASVFERLHDGEQIVVTVAPCSPFSVTPRLMEQSAILARQLGLRLHTHLAETLDEERDTLARFGVRPLELVERFGWIGDDVWFAHGIHFTDAEIAHLAATGTGVAHCPSSNARLSAGMCRVTDLLRAGAPVGLGVDGVASNEDGGLFTEIRQALFTARQLTGRPGGLGVQAALDLGTIGGAKVLGRDDIGVLAPGKRADIAIWPGDDVQDIPDAVAALALGPRRAVRHLLVQGQFVVRDGSLTNVDLASARAQLARISRRLQD